MDNIDPSDFKRSLKIESNLHNIFSSGQGAGKSGSFFFFSADNKFIVKTMRGNEPAVLLKHLDKLTEHFKSTNNQSLLARYYGMFSISSNYF